MPRFSAGFSHFSAHFDDVFDFSMYFLSISLLIDISFIRLFFDFFDLMCFDGDFLKIDWFLCSHFQISSITFDISSFQV